MNVFSCNTLKILLVREEVHSRGVPYLTFLGIEKRWEKSVRKVGRYRRSHKVGKNFKYVTSHKFVYSKIYFTDSVRIGPLAMGFEEIVGLLVLSEQGISLQLIDFSQ